MILDFSSIVIVDDTLGDERLCSNLVDGMMQEVMRTYVEIDSGW